MENASLIRDTNTVLEERNQNYLLIMTTISVILLLFTFVAIVALRRTKSTPETARFLSSGLLFFDITGTLCFTLRRFIVNHYINIFVQVSGVCCIFLAYTTVGIMSFERLIIFSSPHFYLRRVTPSTIKKIVKTLWVVLTIMYFFVRYGLCYTLHSDATMYDVIGRCNNVAYAFYGFFLFSTCIISGVCYWRIFLIERGKGNTADVVSTFRALMKYKTTGIVFLYIMSIVTTTLSYTIILTVQKSDMYATRITTDLTNIASCVIDPCLYVLWYRECRYEVLKMFMCCSSRWSNKLETMRIEIFNIVLTEKTRRFSNKIDPWKTPDVIGNI